MIYNIKSAAPERRDASPSQKKRKKSDFGSMKCIQIQEKKQKTNQILQIFSQNRSAALILGDSITARHAGRGVELPGPGLA
jgi:hypothetical protein